MKIWVSEWKNRGTDANVGFLCNHACCLLWVQFDRCFLSLPDHKNHLERLLQIPVIRRRSLRWSTNFRFFFFFIGRLGGFCGQASLGKTDFKYLSYFWVFFDNWTSRLPGSDPELFSSRPSSCALCFMWAQRVTTPHTHSTAQTFSLQLRYFSGSNVFFPICVIFRWYFLDPVQWCFLQAAFCGFPFFWPLLQLHVFLFGGSYHIQLCIVAF